MDTPTEKVLRQKLADVRQEIRNLTVMGMRPNIPEKEREFIKQLERSARAELVLRTKALDHHLKTKAGW